MKSCTRLRCVVGFVLIAVVALSPVRASADAFDDVERRLKSTGVPAKMRHEIAEAVRGITENLIRLQRADGSFDHQHDVGATALAALALIHSGDARAREAAGRARRWLQRSSRGKAVIPKHTYESGIMAMVLQALAPGDPRLQHIQRRLVELCSGDGMWAYGRTAARRTHGNLSTSQFACLGLWAAERAGLPRRRAPWLRHAVRLVKHQMPDGSWNYKANTGDSTPSYAGATCMGIADLVLAHQALGDPVVSQEAPWFRREWAIRCAKVALSRNARWMLAPVGVRGVGYRMRSSLGYEFLALEKACTFVDTETLAGLDWYRLGAKRLIALGFQHPTAVPGKPRSPSGRLHPGAQHRRYDTANAAFVLLFLLRASEVYRPTTPRAMPTGTPRGPITGPRSPKQPTKNPKSPKETWRLSLPQAFAQLDQLETAVRELSLTHARSMRDLLDAVARTLGAYCVDGVSIGRIEDVWVRRVESLLVSLSIPLEKPGRLARPAWRLVIATDALKLLGQATMRGGQLLKTSLPALLFGKEASSRLGIAYYDALFRCFHLTRLPGRSQWLVNQCMWSDISQCAMTIPAIMALERVVRVDDKARYRDAYRMLEKLRALDNMNLSNGPRLDLQWDIRYAIQKITGKAYGKRVPLAGLRESMKMLQR